MISTKVQPVERRLVYIDDVDIPNLNAHVKDKTGGRWQVSFRDTGGHTRIPKQGEAWIAERNRNQGNDWHLVQRRHSRDEYNDLVDTGQPGDYRLGGDRVKVSTGEIDIVNPNSADPTSLLMEAGDVNLQVTTLTLAAPGGTAHPIAATRRERMVTVGATTTWTLANAPVDLQTVMLFDNGLLVDPLGVTLLAKVLTFPSIAISHTLVVYYQTLAT